MAREGLAETRQALSALRGEMSPVEDFLSDRRVATADGADITVSGCGAAARRGLRRCAGWRRKP